MDVKANGSSPENSTQPATDESANSENRLVQIIQSQDDTIRNQSLDLVCAEATFDQLMSNIDALDKFWRQTENLYHRVRALFFLSAIHRFHLPRHFDHRANGNIPFNSYQHLLGRRFVEAIDSLLLSQTELGPSDALSSALSQAYHELAFQTLACLLYTSPSPRDRG